MALCLVSAMAAQARGVDGTGDSVPQPKPLRPVLSAYMAEVGSAHLADTYLTPLRYSGMHYGLAYERMQAMKASPENWIMQLDVRVDVDRVLNNPTRNAVMWNANVDLRWAAMRRWQVGGGLTLGIGPGIGLRGGALYLSRNGNNPASAKGAVTFDARGIASYPVTIGRLPVVFRYEVSLPVTGAFFAPDYGQLYYEIWLGERSGLCRAAWWGNYFDMDNLLTADLRLGGTTLRLGYRNHIISTKASDIVSRRISHAFVIGIATEWLSLSPRHRQDVPIVSPLY